jgi:hypothetical protein
MNVPHLSPEPRSPLADKVVAMVDSCARMTVSDSAAWMRTSRWMSLRALLAVVIGLASLGSGWSHVLAQELVPPPVVPTRGPSEQFVPADQLDAVFNRDRRGVMMKRDEFRKLLEQARANAAGQDHPVSILAEQATLTVEPSDQHALVTMELRVRQFVEGWQMLAVPAGNLLVEDVTIGEQSAVIGRDPENPTRLLLAHEGIGEFTIIIKMSTPLVALGSDQTAAFELPQVPATQLIVNCPAGRHLLVNDLRLDRPAENDEPADYHIPTGTSPNVRLRWVVQQKETEAQTLVFVHSNTQLQVQKESLRWSSESRVSVFGGTINRMIARVPSQMEITSVESAGLEAWTLDDDPENAGQTRVTLTYRQPFSNDRLIRITAVTANSTPTTATTPEANDSAPSVSMQSIPTLQFGDVTSHTGRLVVTHEEGLRLISETGGGVRRIAAAEVGLSTEASVFDFWLQQFELKVAARPRDRELFAETSASLRIDDTTATVRASLVIETLNAPLFEIAVTLPADWQLQSVTDGSIRPLTSGLGPGVGQMPNAGVVVPPMGLTWSPTSDANQILVKPSAPVAPGQLLTVDITLQRTINDPDIEQRLALPVVTVADTVSVGGTYVVQFADDLTVSPAALNGLTPVAGSGAELVFQNPGTPVSGELLIVRKPSRLAARSVLKTWMDSRQVTFDGEIITDVLNGTIRTLTIRLSETLGPDVRFTVHAVGPVPGMTPVREIRQVTIAEQLPGEPTEGLRPFTLKLDHRFAGSLSLRAFVRLPRDGAAPVAAPIVQVADAVRQHGVLVFEASPEQQLSVGPDVRSIPGLFAADASVVDQPDVATGRRVALVFRFVQPGYAFAVNETRFSTIAVPSAVCEKMTNVCTLNDSGSIQRWCQASIRSSGVQTLRFQLPEGENQSFLWSTMLNGEPVEVRREGDAYLVAVPADGDGKVYSLTVLFESAASKNATFGESRQSPLTLAIDAGELQAIPIDVLQQSWTIHYPRTSLLVDSDGQFRPVSGIDQPGWLVSLGRLQWPDISDLPRRIIPLAFFFLTLFVLTIMISRRRWKTLAAVCGLAVLFAVLSFSTLVSRRQYAREAAGRSPSAADYANDGVDFFSLEGAAPPTAAPASPMARFDMPPGDDDYQQDKAGAQMGMGGMAGAIATPMAEEPMSAPEPTNEAAAQQIPAPPAPEESIPNLVQSGSTTAPSQLNELGIPIQNAEGRSGIAARPKKGTARLSVNVDLEIPDDYQSREFLSVADAVHQPSVLNLIVLRRDQIVALRAISAILVVIMAWRLRNSNLLWKVTVSLIVFLIALGMLPLVPNAWQSVPDGLAIGAVISLLMAVATSCCQNCCCPGTWFRNRRTCAAAGLTFAWALQNAAIAQDSTIPQPDLVVPYSADQPPLRSDQVFIRHDDFLKIYQLANPDALKSSPVSPVGSAVTAMYLKTTGLTAVDGTKQILSFDGRLVVWCDADTRTAIPLPLCPVAVRSILVDGNEGSLEPLAAVIAQEKSSGPEQSLEVIDGKPNQQRAQAAPAKLAEGTAAYSVIVTGRGLHVVDLKFDIEAVVEGELGRADLPLRKPTAGTLEWTLPADGLEARINGRTTLYRRDGRTVTVPIAQYSTIRMQWLPAVQKVVGEVVYHSTLRSTLAVEDSGLTYRTTVQFLVRQGEISEAEVAVPEGYSVQSVTGNDLSGWAIQNTDASRSLALRFRRAVPDETTITIQLYAGSPSKEQLTSLAVPILSVKGASRDSGSVILKTGPQFQVRSESLSAVTQVNPGDAAVPEGDELPGRAMLAWRYTRHPASVTVRVTPTADEMNGQAVHAVRLEEQRQLWSSRFTLAISGSPRSRIDLIVPAAFLPLDVTATGMKDWYVISNADEDAAAEPPTDSQTKTISIQLTDARTGPVQIAIQGQMTRDADRTLLNLSPPVILGVSHLTSQLAIWLDAASESAGFESGIGNGGDWITVPPAAAQPVYAEIAPDVPSLAFRSSAVEPSPLTIRLRDAVSTLIGESVTVTNVTDTALEMTLALNWVINRAAADTFAVELSSGLASIMNFEVPGLRRILREDLGDGRMRLTIQLQQPVTDRVFFLGTASLPIPTEKIIRAETPVIVVPSGAPSTISAQQHFWVIVNQSEGLLQPTVNQPERNVRQEQITTQIPPELMQQAVAIVKLQPDTATWNLAYPEQHQVAPAVVTLATHTTVISDDGSWRSHHQLQVTNESRQFLPLVLPENSRLLNCLVQGRPSRVVVRGEGKNLRYLIPIPQSGVVASGFEVEFALAGRFSDSVASVRKNWQVQRLVIPVPTFPEFRDDPTEGISVSRNRWSVYVPQSWRAVLVDDPSLTNVTSADADALSDASLLSEVEQATSLLKAAKEAKSDYLRMQIEGAVELKLDVLNRASGNTLETEQQRNELLGRLGAIRGDLADQDRSTLGQVQSSGVMDNRYLYEQELRQNSTNFGNTSQFWNFNGVVSGSGAIPQSASGMAGKGVRNLNTEFSEADAESRFRFGLTIPDVAKPANGRSPMDDAERKTELESIKKELREEIGEKEKSLREKADSFLPIPNRVDAGEESQRARQSQLMQRRSQSNREAVDKLEQADPARLGFSDESIAAGQQAAAQVPQQNVPGMNLNFQDANDDFQPSARVITPSGLLSLQFEIPTDGLRMDFLRSGGNPALALDVRSSESLTQGLGLLWLGLCGVSILLLTGPGKRNQPLQFVQRLSLILLVAGMTAWLLTGGILRDAGLMAAVLSAIGLMVTIIIQRFRQPAEQMGLAPIVVQSSD